MKLGLASMSSDAPIPSLGAEDGPPPCVPRGRDTRQEDVEKPFDPSTRRVTYPESYITKYTTYTKITTHPSGGRAPSLREWHKQQVSHWHRVQGYLAHKKQPPPQCFDRARARTFQ